MAYLNELVDRRLAEPTEDIVGDLARAANEGAITRKELLSSLFQLIVAGHHTTTSLIGNGVAALLPAPGAARRTGGRPEQGVEGHRGVPPLRRAGAALDVPLRRPRPHDRRDRSSLREFR